MDNIISVNFDQNYEEEDKIFYLKIKELNIQQLLKYKYLEELKVTEFIENDIDLSELKNLKKLTINGNNDITIILPNSIEELNILNVTDDEYKVNLINYENLMSIYCETNVAFSNNLNNCTKLKRVIIKDIYHLENIDLSNCKNLYYLYISGYNIYNINLEKCNKLQYANLNLFENAKSITFPITTELEYVNLYISEEIEDIITINNLYDNKNIKELSTTINLDFESFPKLEKLEIADMTKNYEIIDISKNFNLKMLEIVNMKIKYIDFPYNFNGKINILSDYNEFPDRKVITRRRVYLLVETPLKGSVLDGLSESFRKENSEGPCGGLCDTKCRRCKKNILKQKKLNIRKFTNIPDDFMKYTYITCC